MHGLEVNLKRMISSISSWLHHRYQELLKIYVFAVVVYTLPFLCLAIFILDQLTVQKTDMYFWVFFLVGLQPCGLVGMLLSVIGLIWARKRTVHNVNLLLGIIGTGVGLLWLLGGAFGLALIYLVVA